MLEDLKGLAVAALKLVQGALRAVGLDIDVTVEVDWGRK
jgi:hypothetical protein